jgi:HNH endonuclease
MSKDRRPTTNTMLRVLRRDGFRCQECGLEADLGTGMADLQLHHRVPFIIGGDNSAENMVVLCGTCHKKADTLALKDHRREAAQKRRAEKRESPLASPRQLTPDMLRTTVEAGRELGISGQRVRVLITTGRLPAIRQGRDWLIDPADLPTVAHRPPGYPKGRPRNLPLPHREPPPRRQAR